jgi:hypothetical protein
VSVSKLANPFSLHIAPVSGTEGQTAPLKMRTDYDFRRMLAGSFLPVNDRLVQYAG